MAEHGRSLGVVLAFFLLMGFIKVPVQLEVLSFSFMDLGTSALTLVMADVAKAGVLDLTAYSVLSHL